MTYGAFGGFKRAAIVGLVGVTLGVVVVSTQDSSQPVGLVDEISGSWIVNQGSKRLNRGDLLLNTQTVRFTGTSTGKLSVHLLDSGKIWSKTCSPATPCVGTFRPVGLDAPTGFFAFLTRYWTSERELSTVFARARGPGGRGPSHSLLVASKAGVDLTPLLATIPPGRYDGAFDAAPESPETHVGQPRELAFTVLTGKPVIANLTPGLYAVTIRTSAGQIGSTVLAGVVAEGDPVIDEWKNAVAKVEALGLTPDAADILRARILYALRPTDPR